MTLKTQFSVSDFTEILSNYRLGEYQSVQPFSSGTVQTTLALTTTQGRYVLKYYENRPAASVLFEANLLKYLKDRHFPCPTPIRDKHGKLVGSFRGKAFALFEFGVGRHVENPTQAQRDQLIYCAAQLHRLTRHYRPANRQYRWNYSLDLWRELIRSAAQGLNTTTARQKLDWLEAAAARLHLPPNLPKGICHCDLNASNVLFQGDEVAMLLDFDDANYTYLLFDLVGLIESAAWRHDQDHTLNFSAVRQIIAMYDVHRRLNSVERRHLFDVYRLSILFDAIWYLERGNAEDFYERQKIEFLENVGRGGFYERLFDHK